jgi:hypothetical protein
MKTLILTALLLFVDRGLADAPIPVREPEPGESRPYWWLNLWMHPVVVIEGTIEWSEEREPEIQIKVDREILEGALGKQDAESHERWSRFRIGQIEPKRLVFATPGLTSSNLRLRGIGNGQNRELKFLIPTLDGAPTDIPNESKQSGVFIFRYGSMMTSMPLILDGSIPQNGMASAEALFEHRNRFDHRKLEGKPGEQAGTGQPAPRPESKSEGSDKPQTESEGRSR